MSLGGEEKDTTCPKCGNFGNIEFDDEGELFYECTMCETQYDVTEDKRGHVFKLVRET